TVDLAEVLLRAERDRVGVAGEGASDEQNEVGRQPCRHHLQEQAGKKPPARQHQADQEQDRQDRSENEPHKEQVRERRDTREIRMDGGALEDAGPPYRTEGPDPVRTELRSEYFVIQS